MCCGMDAMNVTLCPSIDYITSNKIFDELGLCMYSVLKVLICFPCRVALTSGMVAGHREKHHYMYQVSSRLLK